MTGQTLPSSSRRAFLLGRAQSVSASTQPIARVAASCLEERGTSCRLCEDACDAQAIRLRPLGRGLNRVVIANDRCTGCGLCVPVCPVNSIRVDGLEMETA